MNAKPYRLAITGVFLCLAAPGFAQMTTDNPSSTPTGKGTAADGSRPAEGAIKGGTRQPDVDVARPPPTREAPPPQNPPR